MLVSMTHTNMNYFLAPLLTWEIHAVILSAVSVGGAGSRNM